MKTTEMLPAGHPRDRDNARPQQPQHGHQGTGSSRRMYLRFGAMIATSTMVMFALTYTNTFALAHVRWSEERVYMALLMGSAMTIIMLGFMASMMYKNNKLNAAILVGALVMGGATLWLSRSQSFVDDRAYMKGMIPHHSIAILTSERADIDDVRVRELADEIIEAQRREIAEMDWLIDDIEKNGSATTTEEADHRPVPDFETTP
ncbi:DUF305 domain-containing protein [Sanguibacter antarcticus]|uniref:DUF305 domain-containing protein n=1 Tax=Sanguibacter antarcticus TaxID=372484 RepID=A0A2A9E1F2_9MICO|nr:DUF305 domain-containing protein [Sanguibacter antarcticus]PFG32401.1 protein of unknown function (DUF305) [Sanguibacter antarcticus]